MGNWKLENTRNWNTGTIGILEHFQTRKLESKTEEQILHNLVTERRLQKKISVIGMATRIGNPITATWGESADHLRKMRESEDANNAIRDEHGQPTSQ
jgi:hypothetical protein